MIAALDLIVKAAIVIKNKKEEPIY